MAALLRMYNAAVANENAARELRSALQEVIDCVDEASRAGLESPFPNFRHRTTEAARAYFAYMSEEDVNHLVSVDLPRINAGPWGERIRENFLLDSIQSLEFFKILKDMVQKREG